MAQCLRKLTTLAEGGRMAPSSHARCLTTACKSSSRDSGTSGLHERLCSQAHYSPTLNIKMNFKKFVNVIMKLVITYK